jgi:hypothetical protein
MDKRNHDMIVDVLNINEEVYRSQHCVVVRGYVWNKEITMPVEYTFYKEIITSTFVGIKISDHRLLTDLILHFCN